MEPKLATVDDYGIAKSPMRQHIERESLDRAPSDCLTRCSGLCAGPPEVVEPRAHGSAQRPVESVDPCTKNMNAGEVSVVSHLGW
jgi:hypothetical protein